MSTGLLALLLGLLKLTSLLLSDFEGRASAGEELLGSVDGVAFPWRQWLLFEVCELAWVDRFTAVNGAGEGGGRSWIDCWSLHGLGCAVRFL